MVLEFYTIIITFTYRNQLQMQTPSLMFLYAWLNIRAFLWHTSYCLYLHRTKLFDCNNLIYDQKTSSLIGLAIVKASTLRSTFWVSGQKASEETYSTEIQHVTEVSLRVHTESFLPNVFLKLPKDKGTPQSGQSVAVQECESAPVLAVLEQSWPFSQLQA